MDNLKAFGALVLIMFASAGAVRLLGALGVQNDGATLAAVIIVALLCCVPALISGYRARRERRRVVALQNLSTCVKAFVAARADPQSRPATVTRARINAREAASEVGRLGVDVRALPDDLLDSIEAEQLVSANLAHAESDKRRYERLKFAFTSALTCIGLAIGILGFAVGR